MGNLKKRILLFKNGIIYIIQRMGLSKRQKWERLIMNFWKNKENV